MSREVNSSSGIGAVTKIEQMVIPPCACGHPSTAHSCRGVVENADDSIAPCTCQQYTAMRPVRDLGLRAYTHYDRLCRAFWWIEVRLQGFRERRERVLEQRLNRGGL